MAKWIKVKNNKRVDINKIPIIEVDDMRSEVKAMALRPVGFFGKDWGFGCVRLFVILADDSNAELYLSSVVFGNGIKSYESFTQEVPAFHPN